MPKGPSAAGLCYATEDRKKPTGLVLINDIRQNIPRANPLGVANGLVVATASASGVVAQRYRTRIVDQVVGASPE